MTEDLSVVNLHCPHCGAHRDFGCKESYVKAGKIDHAMCVHDAVRDVLNTGRVHPATIEQATKLGIPIPVGRGY